MSRPAAIGLILALLTMWLLVVAKLAQVPATPEHRGEAAPVWRVKPPEEFGEARPILRAHASRSRSPQARAGRHLNWTALAQCESSNNPRAISASGKYRGLYQMDARFWATYGGKSYAGSPENATVREQTLVAERGYDARGARPWPVCGRRL